MPFTPRKLFDQALAGSRREVTHEPRAKAWLELASGGQAHHGHAGEQVGSGDHRVRRIESELIMPAMFLGV